MVGSGGYKSRVVARQPREPLATSDAQKLLLVWAQSSNVSSLRGPSVLFSFLLAKKDVRPLQASEAGILLPSNHRYLHLEANY